MKDFHFTSGLPPGPDQGGRKPFAVHFQSKSPVLGCLLALAVLIAGGLLAIGAGVAALFLPVGLLLWRVAKELLPGHLPNTSVSATSEASPGVIDVEATVLPPSIEGGTRQGVEDKR